MQIKRFLRASVIILTCFILAFVAYAGLYVAMFKGTAAMDHVDPANGTRTKRCIPIYHRPQMFSADWSGSIESVFAPIHHLDRIMRPKQWPKDQVSTLSPAEKERAAFEFAVAYEQYRQK